MRQAPSPVIASEARQSRARPTTLDCFVAELLAMTAQAEAKVVMPGLDPGIYVLVA